MIKGSFQGSDPLKEQTSNKKELTRQKAQRVQRSEEGTLQLPLSRAGGRQEQANMWR